MLDVCLLGTGGMMPLPNRYLTAAAYQCQGSTLLIDCGEGTQIAMRKAGLSFNPIDVICITHEHGDHLFGLPGLLQSMANAERTNSLTIICPQNVQCWISIMLKMQPALPFAVNFLVVKNNTETFTCGPYVITAFKVNHKVTCYGYTVEVKRLPKFNVEKAKALPIPVKMWNLLQHGQTVEHEGVVYTPDMVMGDERKGIKVAYCTDTRPVPRLVENAMDADLFICEAMYGDEEKVEDARQKKHMMMSEAVDAANKANVKELWLTHFSPSMPYPNNYIENARKVFANTKVVPDGMMTTIQFQDN